MASIFSEPSNTKHLVPSYNLINPFTFSNQIRNGFAPIKDLYEMS